MTEKNELPIEQIDSIVAKCISIIDKNMQRFDNPNRTIPLSIEDIFKLSEIALNLEWAKSMSDHKPKNRKEE